MGEKGHCTEGKIPKFAEKGSPSGIPPNTEKQIRVRTLPKEFQGTAPGIHSGPGIGPVPHIQGRKPY